MRQIRFENEIPSERTKRILLRWLPSLVFFVSAAIAAGFWLTIAHQKRVEFAIANRQTAVSAQSEIATRLQARLRNLSTFAARWNRWGEPAPEHWAFDAQLYEKSYPECRSIVLADAKGRVRQDITAASSGDTPRPAGELLFSTLTAEERDSLAGAVQTGAVIMLPCRDYGPDHSALQVIEPLSYAGHPDGFMVASFDAPQALQTITRHLAPGYDLAVFANRAQIYRRGEKVPARAQSLWMQEASGMCGGQMLTTRVWPSEKTAVSVATSYAPIAFFAGTSVSLLLSWLVALALMARRRASESATINRELEMQIDERMLAEAEMQRISAETEVVFASIPSLLIGVDRENVVTIWNDAARRAFGVSAADALGEPVSRSVTLHWDELSSVVEACRESSDTRSLEHAHFTRTDGTEGVLRLTITPIQLPNGLNDGILILGTDVTEQQVMETQLAQSQKLESIGQLAAGIAHEINTPIQYVGDNTRFLGDAFQDLRSMVECYEQLLDIATEAGAPEARLAAAKQALADADVLYLMAEIPAAIAQSLEGVDRVAHLVRAMKDFSHPSNGEKTAVDINRAIDSTVTVARNEWKYVAELVLDLDPDLPMVACLPGEMNQVILNMVVNAAHAIGDVVGSDGEGKGEIRIRTRRDGEWVEIQISDTGTGMSEDVKNRIFDPFFTTKEVGRGTGQGLSISRAVIIERHGGTISVETAPGKGATFSIRLPIDGNEPNHQSEAA